jgi:hypothetical protein
VSSASWGCCASQQLACHLQLRHPQRIENVLHWRCSTVAITCYRSSKLSCVTVFLARARWIKANKRLQALARFDRDLLASDAGWARFACDCKRRTETVSKAIRNTAQARRLRQWTRYTKRQKGNCRGTGLLSTTLTHKDLHQG